MKLVSPKCCLSCEESVCDGTSSRSLTCSSRSTGRAGGGGRPGEKLESKLLTYKYTNPVANDWKNEKQPSLCRAQGRRVHDCEHRDDDHRPQTTRDLERHREAEEKLADEGELVMLPDVHCAYHGRYRRYVRESHRSEKENGLVESHLKRRSEAKM